MLFTTATKYIEIKKVFKMSTEKLSTLLSNIKGLSGELY